MKRRASPLQGNDERDTTLNQLLSEMDGFGDQGGRPTQVDPNIQAHEFPTDSLASLGVASALGACCAQAPLMCPVPNGRRDGHDRDGGHKPFSYTSTLIWQQQ